MEESPIERLMEAVDLLDVEAVMALMSPDPSLLTVDGTRAHGREEVSSALDNHFRKLRSTSHRITNQWHTDDVWIAEVDTDYELRDHLKLKDIPRAFILQASEGRITELHVYGANEETLSDPSDDERGDWTGRRWIPPL